MNKSVVALILLASVMVAGCDKYPVNRLLNPQGSNTAGQWGDTWVIYDDEIKTGGTVMAFTTSEGQALDFSSSRNPRSGGKCIKYSWNGSDVTVYKDGSTEHSWVGFSLIAAQTVADYDAVSRDLTPGGYNKIQFWVRGTLYSGVSLKVKGNSPSDVWLSNNIDHKVTSDWQPYELSISSSSLRLLKDFVKVSLIYSGPEGGSGGTVYLDDIKLTQ